MGQRSTPAPFLTKTYEMVDDKTSDDVISWGENGSTFVVWKTAEFAKDLLPKFFKHNNFSSFVRQLNTYGFRKIVPDKWEFANDNFKKDQKDLLSGIRRRKATLAVKVTGVVTSPCISGDDAGSTSTASPGSVEIADLSGENEKLRRDNEMLNSELAQTKKQCEELMGFLTAHLKVGPDEINHILEQGMVVSCGAHKDGFVGEDDFGGVDNNEEEDGFKLFGVWLNEVGGVKKRGRCYDEFQRDNNSNLGFNGAQCRRKIMKIPS
ncbi:heat shock factor protein HSF24-like [Chenopodium quinoa]|uniref:HSF-type DNA-binding domain-containing protein n=1 Tax=Chenopodium quinoa TaxID=63459 RepID=A0A803KXX1_CHEQI|nr:heat shock factor protein HSF24-like [Chenopodium quinoa]